MPVPEEYREEFFTTQLKLLIAKYQIRQDEASQQIDYQRVGYLASVLIMKMYTVHLNNDAYVWFYNWAASSKLKCLKLDSEDWDKRGHFIGGPWPKNFQVFHPHLSFTKYQLLADTILFPPRQPITKREPVTYIGKK